MKVVASVHPMRLAVLREAFDNPDLIFELKYDGFRAIAEVRDGVCHLYSRNRNVYKRFPSVCYCVAASVNADAVLDGEIVLLDRNGRPQFYDLLRRRGEPVSWHSTYAGTVHNAWSTPSVLRLDQLCRNRYVLAEERDADWIPQRLLG